ncbi:MAG TPA: DUF2203 domain-containing protein [Candidatus Binatia bacterium]|nr:DUF2203 domain-containing protein [Candidatus Binatia bacterium]
MDSDPTYTLDEARALLPQVRGTLLQLAIERRRADDSHAALHRRLRGRSDGSEADTGELELTTAELRARVRDLLDHLESLGVVVRDLDDGLVDIPTVRDGEPAWLCWRLSDPELGWWHTTSEGAASRRPL